MLFTCTPPGTRIPGYFPGPQRARGKWFTVDIHCHVHFEKADEMVRPFWNPERDATMKFANDRTREVQRLQMERTHSQLTSVEKRLADMDVMGIDMQAISPAPVQMFYWTEPDLGLASARAVNDNLAEIVGRHPDRFTPMGTIPFQAPEFAIQELERITNAGVPRHRDFVECRRDRFLRPEIPPDLSAAAKNSARSFSCTRRGSPKGGGLAIIISAT